MHKCQQTAAYLVLLFYMMVYVKCCAFCLIYVVFFCAFHTVEFTACQTSPKNNTSFLYPWGDSMGSGGFLYPWGDPMGSGVLNASIQEAADTHSSTMYTSNN